MKITVLETPEKQKIRNSSHTVLKKVRGAVFDAISYLVFENNNTNVLLQKETIIEDKDLRK